MTNKNTLEVFDPTDKFIRFVLRNYLPYQIEIERDSRRNVRKLVVHDYKIGSYNGILGVGAFFNNKLI